jgi:hypothetical protein
MTARQRLRHHPQDRREVQADSVFGEGDLLRQRTYREIYVRTALQGAALGDYLKDYASAA